MTEEFTKHLPAIQPNIGFIGDPTPRINLATSEDIRREMAKVYRESRGGKIATSEATRLVYMLTQILKAHEVHVLEQKLLALELAHLEDNK
jgi:hypothetical protein